jgi:hypothetical protein
MRLCDARCTSSQHKTSIAAWSQAAMHSTTAVMAWRGVRSDTDMWTAVEPCTRVMQAMMLDMPHFCRQSSLSFGFLRENITVPILPVVTSRSEKG